MITSEPLTLDYAPPVNPNANRRSIVWTILAIPTCVIPFVNFSCDISPAGALLKAAKTGTTDLDGWLLVSLAAGLCFGLIAFLWRIRLWLPWLTTRVERGIVRSAALAGALFFFVPTVISICKGAGKEIGLPWIIYFISVALASGALFLIRRRNDANAFSLACLLANFLTIATFAVIAFCDDDKKIGWYLTAFVASITVVELLFLSKLPSNKTSNKDN